MDQGGFLTADKRAGAVAEDDVEIEVRAEDVLAEEAVLTGLVDSDLQAVDGQRVLSADIDQTDGGADTETADGHSLDDGVRVAFQDGTIHESAGVTLVSVADDVFLVGSVLGAELPFQTSGEASTATAAETGFLDKVDGGGGVVLFENAGQCLVTITCDVFVNVFGIDETAVTQGDTHLFLVEAHVLGVGDVLLVLGVLIEQALHLTAFDDVLVDDFEGVFGLHLGVEGVVGKNLHDGAFLAEAEATGGHDLNIVGKVLFLQNLDEILSDFGAF